MLKWWLANAPWSSYDFWFGILILLDAFLEHINYYYQQLMYDSRYDWTYLRTHRRLRQGSIGKGLNQING